MTWFYLILMEIEHFFANLRAKREQRKLLKEKVVTSKRYASREDGLDVTINTEQVYKHLGIVLNRPEKKDPLNKETKESK